jgi:hypothetical protein
MPNLKDIVEVVGRPFVNHVDQAARPSRTFNLKEMYGVGHHTNLHDLRRHGYIKSMGYLYILKPFLKNYLVKQFDSWIEYYAPNKTLLRKSLSGKIDKIIEI